MSTKDDGETSGFGSLREDGQTTNGISMSQASTEDSGVDNATLFAHDYSLAKASLVPLPEDEELEQFSGPPIHITAEPEVHDQSDTSMTQSQSQSPFLDSLDVDTLRPIVPSSPNTNRRRSSFNGHRRPGSATSASGLGIPLSPRHRRRSSIISNVSRNEFDDFQEADGDASDFGDFDDAEQGGFDSDVDNEARVSDSEEQTGTFETSRISLPDVSNAGEVRQYTMKAIDSMFMIPSVSDTDGLAAVPEIPVEDVSLKEEIIRDDSEEEDSPFMLTDRAVSLWKQLTAPPPLQPPDWKRSRIRRLFLVSLGIPVDLDEILPKMTHKKLVLPSTRKRDKRSAEERRSRRKIPPPPEFELSSARRLCETTESALNNMSERDLQIHVSTLKAHTTAASDLLTYWLEQRESAQSEKETFEQVVQNLVTYHKRQKDEQKEASSNSKKKARSRFSIRG